MDATRETEPAPTKNRTTTERKSDRELVVKRTFNAPARIVFEAWTKPELFKQLVGTEVDGRVPAFPASWMFVPEASTVSCSATTPQRRWSSSVGTSK